MDVVTTFHGVTIKVGSPVHDAEGNVIGKVKSWEPREGGEIRAVYEISDGKAKDLITCKGGTFSVGTLGPTG